MSKSLNDFEELINSYIEPLLSHIILVLKSRDEGSTEYINHWKKEIRSFLSVFYRCTLNVKHKNEYKIKIKKLRNIFIDKLKLNEDANNILDIINHKCFLEGYDLEDHKTHRDFVIVIYKFWNLYFDDLLETLASSDYSDIDNFIKRL